MLFLRVRRERGRDEQERGNADAHSTERMQRNGHSESPDWVTWMWRALALVVAAVLFWVATSDAVYESTSPSTLSWHVPLRKAYSIGAFALVGFLADKALGGSTRAVVRGTLLVALYSAAIEVAQFEVGSKEGLLWNGIDVVCGAVGGALGALISLITRSHRKA